MFTLKRSCWLTVNWTLGPILRPGLEMKEKERKGITNACTNNTYTHKTCYSFLPSFLGDFIKSYLKGLLWEQGHILTNMKSAQTQHLQLHTVCQQQEATWWSALNVHTHTENLLDVSRKEPAMSLASQ